MKYRSKEQAYHSNSWKKLRKQKLEANPECELCKLRGLSIPAEQIHHSIKFDLQYDNKTKGLLFLDEDNLISLCCDCHHHVHKNQDMLFPEQKQYLIDKKNFVNMKYFNQGIIIRYTNDKNYNTSDK